MKSTTSSAYATPARRAYSPGPCTPADATNALPTPDAPRGLRAQDPSRGEGLVGMAFPLRRDFGLPHPTALALRAPPLEQRRCRPAHLAIGIVIAAAWTLLQGSPGEITAPEDSPRNHKIFLAAGLGGITVAVCAWLILQSLKAGNHSPVRAHPRGPR